MWLLLSVFIATSAADDMCRVLALGGGTDRGAYQAGGIIGLINSLPAGEAQWDVVTGIGIGAVNGMILSQFPKGQESLAAAKLSAFWSKFEEESFYKNWLGWELNGYLFKSGLYNSAPMAKTLQELQTGPYTRFFGVGATDLVTGNYVFFNSTGQTEEVMMIGITASMAQAGVFPYVEYGDFNLVSGDVKEVLDIIQGVEACVDMGFSESNIIVDTVLVSGKTTKSVDPSNYKTLQAGMRYLDIAAYNSQMFVITNAKQTYPYTPFRSQVLYLSKMPDALRPYAYSRLSLKKMLEHGQENANTAVKDLASN